MKKKGEGLPINTLVIVIIAVIVLALILIIWGKITGKEIFPAILEKIKSALGLWKSAGVES